MTPGIGKTTVLHVLLSLEIGGMEQMAADLVRSLDRTRFNPVVACVQMLGPIAAELEAQKIRVIQVPAMPRFLSFLYPGPLLRIMREIRPDMVHVHSGCWYKVAIAARLAGVRRLIYTEHGRTFPDPRLYIVLDRLFGRWTERVVAVSAELADYLREVVEIPADKVTVIINGIDLKKFRLSAPSTSGQPVRIGVVARLAPVKDLGTLLRAMQIVVRTAPETRLEVVGDGPERQSLEQLVTELGITDHVCFHGFRRDIPEVLAGLDIFTLTSLSEGTSMTILEAMSAGKPVVATRVGGNPSIIEEGVNGFLVPAGQPEALAQALLCLVGDVGLRQRIGTSNRNKSLKTYGLQTMTKQYEQLYDPR